MAPVEPWQKVFINLGRNSDIADIDIHLSVLTCVDCHKGDNTKPNSMEEAHQGLVVFPSRYDENGTNVCAECHQGTVVEFRNSLHSKLWGYQLAIAQRAGVENFSQCPQTLQDGFNKECSRCHASCGDCHVAVPNDVGKGFINSHRFSSVPNQVNQCIACHGARVGYDFQGDYDTFPIRKRDVHANSLACIDCHKQEMLHSSAPENSTRYSHSNRATCADEGCHETGVAEANNYHQKHASDFSCYVCHSEYEYQNCTGCHVSGAYLTDPVYQSQNPAKDFRIGLNPLKSDERPYKFVTLRHIPIARDTYDNWGASGTLVDYDEWPTWKYASPHSIQRWTARTDTSGGKTCMASCHLGPSGDETNRDIYLFQEYLQSNWPDEVQANESVVVDGQLPAGW